jgi:hypothetical protein
VTAELKTSKRYSIVHCNGTIGHATVFSYAVLGGVKAMNPHSIPRRSILAAAAASSALLLAGCAPLQMSGPIITHRSDMDEVVNSKGIPLEVTENVMSNPNGMEALVYIQLFYPDGMWMFQTDPARSFTALTNSQQVSMNGIAQNKIPAWFKAKYPRLDWTGTPGA